MGPAWGQQGAPAAVVQAGAPLQLQPSPWLQEKLPQASGAGRQQAATVIDADRMDGVTDKDITATGSAVLRQPGNVVKADRLHYDLSTDVVTANGHVRVNRQGNVYQGTQLHLQLDSGQGGFDQVDYRIVRNGALGTAARVDFVDNAHTVAHDAVYSTCKPEDEASLKGWKPAWYLKGKRILIDNEQDEGYVEKGALVFKGVPIVPIPSGIGFPLSNKRRSGLLAPTISYGSQDGFHYAQPYYFNIAPNRDATVMPDIMTKRGIDLYGQFRYLETDYKGQVDANYMPQDKLRDIKRWRYKLSHVQTIRTGTDLLGDLGLTLNLHRVSDNNYWRDFYSFTNTGTASSNTLTDRLLSNDVRLTWGRGNWSGYVFAQKYQTLQAAAPDNIIPPYDRLPQVHARYARSNVQGFDVSLDLDVTRFSGDQSLTGYPNGTRSYASAQLSHPWIKPWGYLTPTLQLHATQYQTDTPMANGATSATRVLPTASIDSGLIFERDTRFFGRNVQQTLEPRLYYAYTPYRDQSFLPVYDSALKDFNLASIFSANAFSGDDRISDTHAVTAGVTSRLYDSATGSELARFTVAGRKQLHKRQVTLNSTDTPEQRSFSDVLFDGAISWDPKWSARASVQYDPEIRRSIRSVVGVMYSPGPYRTISANYRLQRGISEQVDVGWQWPLNDLWGDRGQDLGPGRGQGAGRWYSVGRVYYSLFRNDSVTPAIRRGITDAILGFEYDGCCWIGRIALRRQQTQSAPVKYSNKIMFQLELLGLSRIGSSPIPTFRDNIPRYMLLRDTHIENSRFSQYD